PSQRCRAGCKGTEDHGGPSHQCQQTNAFEQFGFGAGDGIEGAQVQPRQNRQQPPADRQQGLRQQVFDQPQGYRQQQDAEQGFHVVHPAAGFGQHIGAADTDGNQGGAHAESQRQQ